MIRLPEMVYADGITKKTNIQFRGYNHTRFAADGEIWDMENMSSDEYPLLTPRKKRRTITDYGDCCGMLVHDRVYVLAEQSIFADNVFINAVPGMETGDGEARTMCALGKKIVILPDKLCFDTETGAIDSIERSWSGTVSFADGTLYGEDAAGCCITTTTGTYFHAGDGVTIAGCTTFPENNQTLIIREISEDGKTLTFYENSFTTGAERGTVTISRRMPELDFLCANENRLWGCKGDTIYCSKLGDVYNWNVFDGLSTDSFAVPTGSPGDFTGCITYMGFPCFFKEDRVFKVYGDKPSNFQVMGSATLGVLPGSGKSLAVAGETLYYLSRVGIVAYSGGTPQSIAGPFGETRYKNAAAGSDGRKYYVSMADTAGTYHLFVYDTQYGVWHREDNTQAMDMGWHQGMYLMRADGTLLLLGDGQLPPGFTGAADEAAVHATAEFADFVESDPNRKGTGKLQIRMELEAGAAVTVAMQFDTDGVWRDVKTLTATVKRSFYLPIIPRRSDHFKIRFTGTGMWRVYSLVRESYSGSEIF